MVAESAPSASPDQDFFIDNPVLEAGFTMIPNAILRDPDLSFGAKAIWGILYSHYNKSRGVFPGRESLAREGGCHVNTIDKYLKELKDSGYLLSKRRGLGKTNIYTLRSQRTKVDVNQETQTLVNQESQTLVTPIKEDRTRRIEQEEEQPSVVAKTPQKRESGTQAIIAAYCELIGVEKLANYAKAGAAAKKLAEAGITPEEIPRLFEFVSRWAKGADLNLMLSQVDAWRSSAKVKPPRANGLPFFTKEEELAARRANSNLASYDDILAGRVE